MVVGVQRLLKEPESTTACRRRSSQTLTTSSVQPSNQNGAQQDSMHLPAGCRNAAGTPPPTDVAWLANVADQGICLKIAMLTVAWWGITIHGLCVLLLSMRWCSMPEIPFRNPGRLQFSSCVSKYVYLTAGCYHHTYGKCHLLHQVHGSRGAQVSWSCCLGQTTCAPGPRGRGWVLQRAKHSMPIWLSNMVCLMMFEALQPERL